MGNDDALWARLLVKKISRFDAHTKSRFKVYMDNRCVEIGCGTWLPPALEAVDRTPVNSMPPTPQQSKPPSQGLHSVPQAMPQAPTIIYHVESPSHGYMPSVCNQHAIQVPVTSVHSAAQPGTSGTSTQMYHQMQNVSQSFQPMSATVYRGRPVGPSAVRQVLQ